MIKKTTKTSERKELRKLHRKCKKLWSLVVRKLGNNICSICGTDKLLHAHHIEDSRLCKSLRYDIKNGVCLCARHHKFGKDSAHKSFVSIYKYLINHRLDDLSYIEFHRIDDLEFTKFYLMDKIQELQFLLKDLDGKGRNSS
jgi:hypothetical protein